MYNPSLATHLVCLSMRRHFDFDLLTPGLGRPQRMAVTALSAAAEPSLGLLLCLQLFSRARQCDTLLPCGNIPGGL